jgi:hypothetical protein
MLPANLLALPESERWRAISAQLAAHQEAGADRKYLQAERAALQEGCGALFDPAAQRHLDKTHQQSFTAEQLQQRQDKRRLGFALRNVVRKLTHSPRVYRCGRMPVRNEQVTIETSPAGVARYRGIVSCSRVWLCPVCSQRIANLRAAEVMHAITQHTAAGGAVYFQTFTLAHGYGDGLRELQETVADSFRQVQAGKAWQLAKTKFGIVGSIRALEATHGAAGWHPHLHVIWFAAAELTRDQRRAMHVHTFKVWRRAVVKSAGDQAKPRIGLCPLEVVRSEADTAAYVTKVAGDLDDSRLAFSAAYELTNGRGKLARAGNRTIWEIVRQYGHTRSDRDAELWREWERAMLGRKALTWSRGLKARYGIVDVSDATLLAKESAQATVTATVPGDAWLEIARRPSLQLRVLELVERGKVEQLPAVWRRVMRWCRRVRWKPQSEWEDSS